MHSIQSSEMQPSAGARQIYRPFPTSTAKILYYAGFSDFPHSKHRFLYFDVISPQDGHTLRDPKSLLVVAALARGSPTTE